MTAPLSIELLILRRTYGRYAEAVWNGLISTEEAKKMLAAQAAKGR